MTELMDLDGETPRDNGRHRTLALEDGNKIHFKASDPFGFWSINFERGQLPESLSDQVWTTYDEAEKAVKAYLVSKKKEKATPPAPVHKTEAELFETEKKPAPVRKKAV